MSKIDRYSGNVQAFGSQAQGTERTVFGDTAQSDTLDANITADFLRGWGIVGVNENPTKQDFNGLAFTLGQLIAYLHQRGIPEWDGAQEYYEGSVVTTLAGVYRLLAGGNGTINPDTDDGTNWEKAPTRAEIDQRTIYVGSVAELESLSLAVGTNVYLTQDGRAGEFVVKSGTPPSDPQKGIYIVLANGNYAERQFKLSEGIFISWFGGISDSGTTDNSAAIQAAYDFAAGGDGARYVVWDGRYGFGTTINVQGSITTRGNPADALGSTGLTASTQIWTGGASPMFNIESSRVRWFDLGVLNDGTATDWMYLGPGAILPYWENINFNLPSTTNRFSRSVVYSYGQRLGYGKMKRINTGGSIAPKFIWLDGQTDVFENRVTTFSIEGSVIAAAAGLEMTLFYVRNQGIETLNISKNSFNNNSSDSNLVLVDTTDNPVESVIFNLNFERNEIDHIGTDPALRKFKLTNVRGINFNHNEAALGGQMLHLGDLVNSNVTSYDGNSIRSLGGAVWNADDSSFVVAGTNKWGSTGTVQRTTNNVKAVTARVQQNDTSVLILNFEAHNASGHTIREIDVNVASTFSIRALVDEIDIGTVFTLVYRNVSGGAIAAPNFFPDMFETAGATVAPASGFARTYTFYHNGVKFVEINRSQADVANS